MVQVERRDMSKLEEIVAAIDRRLNTLEKDVEVIKANYATKADVSDAKNTIIMWVVGSVLVAQVLSPLIKALSG